MRHAGIGVWATAVVVMVLTGPSRGLAQTTDQQKGTNVDARVAEQQVASGAPTAAAAIQRWVDLQAASVLARYRYVETDRHVVTSRQMQDSIALKARFKADARGYYTVNATAGTGASFTSGWNNTGLGTGDSRVRDVYVKQLFVAATPVNGVQLSFGGLTFVRGESTEVTTYDNDGYLVGERVSVARPDLYFNEITFTNGYVGDIATPNVFARYHRLWEPNYRQLLVSKRAGGRLTVSADYTHAAAVGTVRAALSARIPRARLVDLVQFEHYRRAGANGASGFGVFAEKAIGGLAVARAGYADIDADYGGLNADRFNSGRRLYVQSDLLLTRDLTALVFVSRAVHNPFAVTNGTRVDVVVTYNAMGPVHRAGLFR